MRISKREVSYLAILLVSLTGLGFFLNGKIDDTTSKNQLPPSYSFGQGVEEFDANSGKFVPHYKYLVVVDAQYRFPQQGRSDVEIVGEFSFLFESTDNLVDQEQVFSKIPPDKTTNVVSIDGYDAYQVDVVYKFVKDSPPPIEEDVPEESEDGPIKEPSED